MTTNQPNPEAVEAAARALNPGDWDYMSDAARQVAKQDAARILAAALPYLLTVKPDRDLLATTIATAIGTGDPHAYSNNPDDECETDPSDYLAADAALAILPGRTEAQVKAEALREAAEGGLDGVVTAEYLDARADRIERGES